MLCPSPAAGWLETSELPWEITAPPQDALKNKKGSTELLSIWSHSHLLPALLTPRGVVVVREAAAGGVSGYENGRPLRARPPCVWEAGGKAMGWASCRKQWQKVEIAKEGFVGPAAGPGPRSAAPQQGLELALPVRSLRAQSSSRPGAGTGGGSGHGQLRLSFRVRSNLPVPKALRALHIVPSLAGHGNADQKAVPGHVQSAN